MDQFQRDQNIITFGSLNSVDKENLVLRLAYIDYIQNLWQTAKLTYGSKTTKALKLIAPSDPMILYDFSVSSFIDEGKTIEEASDIANHYIGSDWENELEGFSHIITTGGELLEKGLGKNIFPIGTVFIEK